MAHHEGVATQAVVQRERDPVGSRATGDEETVVRKGSGGEMKKLKLHATWSARVKLWAEGVKLWAEGDKLWAEGDKLRAEGDKLWAEKIIEAYGNIRMEWKCRNGGFDCWIEADGGLTYKWDETEE
jgi:hypothetical protein